MLSESPTMFESLLFTWLRNSCSVMSKRYLRKFATELRIVGSNFAISRASASEFDCLAAILAAELIILFLVISSTKPLTELGFLRLL